ncbi:MAG: efflux RND transporter periplasmic adaptor subunit [bacterium]
MLKKFNHGSTAIFVFIFLTALFLWLTGNLHIGSVETVSASIEHAEGEHGHGTAESGGEAARDHGEDWCEEHEVPESGCTRCNPSLIDIFKEKGDWCAGHNVPESQCAICNPGCKDSAGHAHGGPVADLDELENVECEHEVPIVQCNSCRFEAGVVKIPPAMADALIKTGEVERRGAVTTLRLTGEVQLDQTRVVDVPPAGRGWITQVSALLGDRVEEGDVLAVIHSEDAGQAKAFYLTAHTRFEIARKEQERQSSMNAALRKLLQRLENESESLKVQNSNGLASEWIGEWKSKLIGSKARVQLARSVYEREEDLQKKKASSKADYEKALQELQIAEAEQASLIEEVHLNMSLDQLHADNSLKQAEADLKAAEQRLYIIGLDEQAIRDLPRQSDSKSFARLEIKAPRTGTVIAQNVTKGHFVEISESLYTIADLSNLWVWCDVYERDLAVIHTALAERKFPQAKVKVAAFPDAPFFGEVDLIRSLLDEHTRTAKIRVQTRNEHAMLKAGMFANVEIEIPTGKQIALLPQEAVLSDEGKSFVFEHWKDDLWARRDVEVGKSNGGFTEVLDGLSEGAQIVTGGAFMLKSDVLREKMGAGCAD